MTNQDFIDGLKNSKTDHAIVDRLKKAGRKFDICDNWRHAVLYCKGCGEKLGEFDLIYESHTRLSLWTMTSWISAPSKAPDSRISKGIPN